LHFWIERANRSLAFLLEAARLPTLFYALEDMKLYRFYGLAPIFVGKKRFLKGFCGILELS
jgi:hypothetical protein